MARARFIRPEFFSDEGLSELPFGARLLFAGIWCQCDLRGVFELSTKQLRALIFPMDDGVTSAQVEEWLIGLESRGMVRRFEAGGKSWGHVINWNRHQTISGREKEIGTRRPPPPDPGTTQGRPRDDTSTVQDPTRVASPSPTLTPATASASTITREPQPPDPMGEAMQAIEQAHKRAIDTSVKPKDFADWRTAIGRRIFIGPDERRDWELMYAAEGWDEMTRGYEHLAKQKPEPQRIFFSEMQALR